MDAAERAAIESRLGRFATMSTEDLNLWFKQREEERAAAAEALRNGCSTHLYLWFGEPCLRCGGAPEEDGGLY